MGSWSQYKTFFFVSDVGKSELVYFLSLVLYLQVEPEPGKVVHLSHPPFLGEFQTLLTKVSPGWKGLTETSTLAYFASSLVTEKKSFTTLRPRPNVIKLFLSLIYMFS